MNDQSLIEKAEKEIDSALAKGEETESNTDKGPLVKQILELIDTWGVDLYLDEQSEPHITLPERPLVGVPLGGSIFKRWLKRKCWEVFQRGCPTETLSQVIGALEGRADSEKKERILYNRVARVGGAVYYDLGDDQRAFVIETTGWHLAVNCPVRFRRFTHQMKQVEPVAGGDLRQVLKYVNLSGSKTQLLFLTYLVAVLIPDVARVILVCFGDQGAAKSTAMRLVRSLVDPSRAELLSPPRDIMELGQAANHNYCLYFDNLSFLSDELSDVLCRLVTGIGFAKRKLYTDSDDVLFNQKVAVGMTGINLVAQKADLLDRSLILSFERISDDRRLEEEAFWSQFEAEKSLLLGALFSALSETLKIAPSIVLPQKPRMADYARYAAAAAVVLGETVDSFLLAFGENTKRQNIAAIESSSTAQVVLEFMKGRNEWEGASSELYSMLKQIAEKANLQIGGSGGFPKAVNWLWRKIKEVKPNLLSLGIEVVSGEVSTNSVIYIRRVGGLGQDVAIATTVAILSSDKDGSMDGSISGGGDDVATDIEAESGNVAVMAAFEEPLRCHVCGGSEFWKRHDGEDICVICHPPVTGK